MFELSQRRVIPVFFKKKVLFFQKKRFVTVKIGTLAQELHLSNQTYILNIFLKTTILKTYYFKGENPT